MDRVLKAFIDDDNGPHARHRRLNGSTRFLNTVLKTNTIYKRPDNVDARLVETAISSCVLSCGSHNSQFKISVKFDDKRPTSVTHPSIFLGYVSQSVFHFFLLHCKLFRVFFQQFSFTIVFWTLNHVQMTKK